MQATAWHSVMLYESTASSAQYESQWSDHATDCGTDHAIDHAIDYAIDHATDHAIDHATFLIGIAKALHYQASSNNGRPPPAKMPGVSLSQASELSRPSV